PAVFLQERGDAVARVGVAVGGSRPTAGPERGANGGGDGGGRIGRLQACPAQLDQLDPLRLAAQRDARDLVEEGLLLYTPRVGGDDRSTLLEHRHVEVAYRVDQFEPSTEAIQGACARQRSPCARVQGCDHRQLVGDER